MQNSKTRVWERRFVQQKDVVFQAGCSFGMCLFLGRTVSEIAGQNGVAPQTVKRWKKQGLLALELPERLMVKLAALVDQEEADQAEIRAERRQDEADALEAFRRGEL